MIKVKTATQKDLDQVVKLEELIWPEGTRASRDKFEKRLKIFPEGFFIAYQNRKIIGVSTSEIVDYNGTMPSSWKNITDDGYIQKTHCQNGNAIYVVSVGSLSRSGGGSILIKAQIGLVKRLNLGCLILGARIPGYDAYCKQNGDINIVEYVKIKREDGDYLDPEIRFYIRNGLRIDKIVPNYMEDDKESRNYGAIMIWQNHTPIKR